MPSRHFKRSAFSHVGEAVFTLCLWGFTGGSIAALIYWAVRYVASLQS